MNIFFALLLGLALPASAAEPSCRPQVAPKTATLSFPNGAAFKIDVVDTPSSREIGLMCRKALPKNYGMLFVFPQEMGLGFWMKNTLVSLDLIWIGADKRITGIAPRLKASRLDTPEDAIARAGGRGQYVLELPAGTAQRLKLKVGDALKFEASTPKL